MSFVSVVIDFLHQIDIKQLTEFAPDFAHDADVLKADCLMQANTGLIPCDNARNQGMQTHFFALDHNRSD